MPFVLRVTSLPTTAELVRVPQIVLVDQTGPAIPFGTAPGVCMLVGEFLKGPVNAPAETSGSGSIAAIYGGISSMFSQDAAGVQNAGGVSWEGGGVLQLFGKTFKRLGITRVNTECVTTDGGGTISQIAVTVTVAAADQAAGVTLRDILVPAGTRFGDNAVFGTATKVVATSQDLIFPKGTAVAANLIVGNVNCFSVKRPEPIVTIAAAAVNSVIDAGLDNVSTGTSITAVTNAAALWPPGTGTTLALRISSQYLVAIASTVPGSVDVTVNTVVIWAARRNTAIRQALLANAVASSLSGRGRQAIMAADPAATTSAADAAAGITTAAVLPFTENLQDDKVMMTFPQSQVTVPDLGGITVTINADGWLSSILSNFPNEVNPGASPLATVGTDLLAKIVSVEQAYVVNPIVVGDYARLLAGGVCPLLKDRTVGWWFLNGITAANATLQPTRVSAKRRRMAFEIQDSLAGIAAPFQKQPATTEKIDAFSSALDAYFEGLLSTNSPSAQRIKAYSLDMTTYNTGDLAKIGVFQIAVAVQLLASMDTIVFLTQVGETVQVQSAA
jgi:hypothetical protein